MEPDQFITSIEFLQALGFLGRGEEVRKRKLLLKYDVLQKFRVCWRNPVPLGVCGLC